MDKNTNFVGAKIVSLETWSDRYTPEDCIEVRDSIIIEKDGKKYRIRGAVLEGEGIVIEELECPNKNMIEVVWICKECTRECCGTHETLAEIIKTVYNDCASCESHIHYIKIDGLSPELSMELFLIGRENLKLRCELEICKIKNREKESVKGD